jgi:hypothetical protein
VSAPANPYKGIRKVRKAQWVYDCSLCEVSTKPRTDLFGVMEAKRQHINGQRHTAAMFKAMSGAWEKAVSDVAGAFGAMATEIVDSVMPAFKQFADVFAAPLNLPHDPSLLADRRKWGGK